MNTEILIKDLEIAYNENGALTLLEYANKGEDYYLDEGLTIPLLVAQGEVNRKHFRRFPNINIEVIREYFGSSESIEHLNAKRQILYSKSIQVGGVVIKGHTAKEEVRFTKTNNIIDVVLYDEEGNVLLGIEIYHTNRKSKEAIKKLNQLNINIYEQDINNEEGSRFLCYTNRDNDKYINNEEGSGFIRTSTKGYCYEEEIRIIEEELRQLQEDDRRNKERIKGGRKHISRLRKDIKAEVVRIAKGYEQIEDQERGIYSERGAELTWQIEDVEYEIRKTQKRIDRARANIKRLGGRTTAGGELNELIGIRRSEVKRIESGINK